MKSISFFSLLEASVLLGLPVQTVCAASTQTYTHTSASAEAPYTDTFTLPAFDPSLGTLEAIDLDVTENATADIIVYNATSTDQAFSNASAVVPTTVTGPGSVTIAINDQASIDSGTAAPGLNDFPGVQSTSSGSTQIDPSNFAIWEGGSGQTVSFNFNVSDSTFSGTALPGVFFGGSSFVGGSTTVTYVYTARTETVPEPSTWAMLVAGVAALGFWRMRRARS